MSTTLASTGHEASTPSCNPIAVKIKAAAALCSVSEITIRRAIARGLLKPCRSFRHVLIPVNQLHRLVEGGN